MMRPVPAPYIDQTADWPTGCESVSTVMLLRYLGADIDVETFVDRYLPQKEMALVDGRLYGPDPRQCFAGSPRDPDSFGCYAPVIVKALEKVCRELLPSMEPVDLTDIPTDLLLRDFIARDMPVIYWASLDMKQTVAGPSWILWDSQEEFTWISNEHCLLLTGISEDRLWFNDPWHDHGSVSCSRALAEQRHREQYSMAVSLQKKKV